MQNAKNKMHEASLISSQQYANLLGILKDWSTIREAFKAMINIVRTAYSVLVLVSFSYSG
jgi:hypothetical protein